MVLPSRQRVQYLILVALVALLAGCAGAEKAPQGSGDASLPGPLVGKRWTLLLVGTSDRLEFATRPWFEISPRGEVTGFDGCNRINTRATLGANNHIEFGDIASTRMACPDMEKSRRVTDMLNSAYAYLIDHDRLVFFGPDQRVLGGWRKS
ncbi:MAG TPA: META domain-containing protein [Halomonas sp.]|nr:META domain-containing protein [Halomonas sp.]